MQDELENRHGPIYRRIMNLICRKIREGEWPAGHQLPTVRKMAEEIGISVGTVKHAYDELEQLGLVEMTQGRGTFVKGDVKQESQSRKELAMTAIEDLFDELDRLAFSKREIRIFLELKLRERDAMYQNVRVGVIDCNPEALDIIYAQLSEIPNVDISKFLLKDALSNPYRMEETLDLVITTSNHLEDVQQLAKFRDKLMFMVLSPSQSTAVNLAKLAEGAAVGILCASQKFSEIIWAGCERFCTLQNPPEVALLGKTKEVEGFLARKDVLVMPKGYLRFCTKGEEKALGLFLAQGKQIISFDYQIDKGSFFYLRERIEQIYRSRDEDCSI